MAASPQHSQQMTPLMLPLLCLSSLALTYVDM